MRHTSCKLIVANFNYLDDMEKVLDSLVKRPCRILTANSSVLGHRDVSREKKVVTPNITNII